MEVGKLYKLDAPWHRSHNKYVLVMCIEIGISEAKLGEKICLLLENPFEEFPIQNWTDEFTTDNLKQTKKWDVLYRILSNKSISKIIDLVHDDFRNTSDSVNDYSESLEDYYIYLTDEDELIMSNHFQEDSISIDELIYILNYYNIKDDQLLFFDFKK